MKISQKFHSALAAILLTLQISGVLALPTPHQYVLFLFLQGSGYSLVHRRRELVLLFERTRQVSQSA